MPRSVPRKPSPWTRKRLTLIAVVALMLAGFPYACSKYRASRAERLHAEWMEYEPPADLVVYEEDRAEAARLLAAGDGHFVLPGAEDKPPLMAGETPVAHFPPHATALQKRIPGGCAFLHWLRGPDAETLVLVSIGLVPGNPAARSTRGVSFTAYKLDPSTAANKKPPAAAGAAYVVPLGPDDVFRVRAGRRDVGDATHFTIAWERNGRPGTLHGIMQPDGTIVMRPSRSSFTPLR